MFVCFLLFFSISRKDLTSCRILGEIVKKHQEIRTLRRVITTTQQIQEETSKSFYSTFRDASFSVGSRQSAREREKCNHKPGKVGSYSIVGIEAWQHYKDPMFNRINNRFFNLEDL